MVSRHHTSRWCKGLASSTSPGRSLASAESAYFLSFFKTLICNGGQANEHLQTWVCRVPKPLTPQRLPCLPEPTRYLFAREQLACRVAQSDLAHGPSGALCAPARPERGGHVKKTQWKELTSVNVTHLGLIYSCAPEQVEYIACGSPVSVAVAGFMRSSFKPLFIPVFLWLPRNDQDIHTYRQTDIQTHIHTYIT